MVWGESRERCCKVRLSLIILWSTLILIILFSRMHFLSSWTEQIDFYCFSWLRKRWNSSSVVIAGAEDEEYRLTLDDVDSCLVYMYTPVTEEGAKGEPQYSITDYVKAGVKFDKTLPRIFLS